VSGMSPTASTSPSQLGMMYVTARPSALLGGAHSDTALHASARADATLHASLRNLEWAFAFAGSLDSARSFSSTDDRSVKKACHVWGVNALIPRSTVTVNAGFASSHTNVATTSHRTARPALHCDGIARSGLASGKHTTPQLTHDSDKRLQLRTARTLGSSCPA
jgi:hypothetical protein